MTSKDLSFASTSSGSFKDSNTNIVNPPMVTALAWSITDGQTGELLWGKDVYERMEMASLTKIMTSLTVIKILRLLKKDPSLVFIEVSVKASQIIGTTAGLVAGDKLKVSSLLYALMLPSGNDAAVCLAEGCGKLLIEAWGKDKHLKSQIKKRLNMISAKDISGIDPLEIFVRYMNRIASKLGLARSTFSNPNGLADKANKSTAGDIGKLVYIAKKEPIIAAVVATKAHKCMGITKNGREREYSWGNTNLLLKEGYDGFKTGITPTAGPCLVGTKTYRDVPLIITLLHSKTCEHRWKEINSLFAWAAAVIDSIYANSEGSVNLKKLPILFHKAL